MCLPRLLFAEIRTCGFCLLVLRVVPFAASPLPLFRSPRAGPEADPRAGMANLVRRILEDARGFAPERAAATAARVVQGLAPSTVASYLATVRGFERHSGRALAAQAPISDAALQAFVLHLVESGRSRDYARRAVSGLGTVMELAGFPRPADALLRRLLQAAPQPISRKRKAATQ